MEFADAECGAGGAEAGLDGVGDVGVCELSYRELKDRVVDLAGERARLEGKYLAALDELTSRVGAQAAAHQLRELTRMNSAQARTESRLDDGTPLSAQMLAEHAVDAKVLPAVFKADWSELALGRSRNASDTQRLVLAVRDGGCIGCG